MITKKDVEYVARLARLELTEEEKELYSEQLATIFQYIEKLNELDTGNISPLYHSIELSNVFREDQVEQSLDRDDIMLNAPEQFAGHFLVKKIIKE